jgi:hypothetical protein
MNPLLVKQDTQGFWNLERIMLLLLVEMRALPMVETMHKVQETNVNKNHH